MNAGFHRWGRGLLLTAAIFLFVTGCSLPAAGSSGAQASGVTSTPFLPGEGGGADEGASTSPTWWIVPELPEAAQAQLALPEDAQMAASRDEANLAVAIGEGSPLGTWTYALVAPFPTIEEEFSLEGLQAFWRGEGDGLYGDQPLLMTAATKAVFTAWWGEPAVRSVEALPANVLLDAAWDSRPSWALVPFEDIAPRWKVLLVDDQSPIHKDFDAANYALNVPIGLVGDAGSVEQALAELAPLSNRDPEKLTTVLLTGVTALVRATAWEMERKGITYPAEDVGPVMRAADITHISNEVPFAENCPVPDPSQRTLVFCSASDYIQLMEAVGTDVVELTGDHFNDWTRDAMLYTLQLYKQEGWPYYGGGENIEEAKKPLLLEDHGNKIAFIGCNGKGGGYASAKEDYPGAGACDYDYMVGQIHQLKDAGYVVIVTFQHNEVYTYIPQPGAIHDFGLVAEAGASIVSGSQAHQAHGMEFKDDDTLIMYGLGNMFFDQIIFGYDTSHAMMARHVIYDGRYISTEIIPIVFVDYAKPRLLDADERAEFLQKVFDASLWNN